MKMSEHEFCRRPFSAPPTSKIPPLPTEARVKLQFSPRVSGDLGLPGNAKGGPPAGLRCTPPADANGH